MPKKSDFLVVILLFDCCMLNVFEVGADTLWNVVDCEKLYDKKWHVNFWTCFNTEPPGEKQSVNESIFAQFAELEEKTSGSRVLQYITECWEWGKIDF